MRASGEFDVRTMKSASAIDTYSKRIAEQKVHLFEAAKRYKDFNKVVEQQLKLQRAQAVAWKQMPDGRMSADLIMPNDVAPRLMKTRMQISVLNELLKSSADNMVKWGKNTQWAGRQLTVGFSVPMSIAAAATGKLAYEMDKSLTAITKVYGDANNEWQATTESLRTVSLETAKNMASLYGQSAKDTLEITAQFAAAGKEGVELQNATAAATRARQLNEMDLQSTIQASIALQTVYGYSAEELGQKWDYINAVANQTVLGAEDFAVGIPKVAGVMKELGGTLEDVGVLLTAFKAAGIDAAEGANALKTISFRAVSAYGKGLQTFTAMTGENLQSIVKQTNGETIPTLLAMYKAMENLSAPQKIAVVKDVFGIYQGNKALMLMEQLAGQSEQVAKAMAVGKNSIAENAAIANQELQRMNEQPFKRIQKAVESLKIAMAEIGKQVLPIVADVIETVADLISGRTGIVGAINELFGHLSDIPAKMKILLAVGLAGPLTMLAGLFVNLAGNGFKLMGVLGSLAARYKITNAEERTQLLLSREMGNVWNAEAAAAAALTLELRKMNAAYAANIKTEKIATHSGMMQYDNVYKDPKTGRWHDSTTGTMVKGGAATVNKNASSAGENSREIYAQTKALEARNEQYRNLSRNIGGAAAAGGLLATVFGDGEGVLGKVMEVGLVLGTINALFPSMGALILKTVIEPFRNAGKAIDSSNGRLSVMKSRVAGIGAGLKGFASAVGGPLLIALAAVLAIWNQIHDSEQKSLEQAKAYGETAKALGDAAGVNYTESNLVLSRGANADTGGRDPGAVMADEMAKKFSEANAAAADELKRAGRETGDAWGEAIAQGVQVRLHGGTVEAAKEATRAALAVMGQRFKSDAQFEVQLNTKINFEDPQSMIENQFKNINAHLANTMNDNGTGFWQGFGRKVMQNDDLTARSSEIVQQQAKKMSDLYLNATEAQRPRILEEIRKSTNTGMETMYNQMLADKSGKAKLDKLGIKTISDFQNALQDKRLRGGDFQNATDGNYFGFDYNELKKASDQSTQAIRKIGLELGLFDQSNIETLDSWQQLVDAINKANGTTTSNGLIQGQVRTQAEANQMLEEYGLAMDRAAQAGETLDAQDRLAIVNKIRLAHGYDYVTAATDGFTYSQEKAAAATANLAETMDKLNFNPTISQEQVTSTYKQTITDTMDEIANTASRQADAFDERAMDALDREMDSALKAYDDKSDKLSDKFDKQKAAFDKKWDARKDRESAYYDSRIDKVNAAIKVEEKAEEIRQRIYEAEKARIERMSQMYNKNIDFNMALNTGNLDEAAKISNDMQAQTAQWSLDDTIANSGDTSKTTVDKLNAQKDALGKAKDARMKVLDDQKKAEEDALKHSQEMEKKRLDNAKDATKASYDYKKATLKAELAQRKITLEQELAAIRAAVPRNKAEMDAQIAAVKAAYAKYGVHLKGNGQAWGKYVADAWTRNMQINGAKLKSDVAWATIGAEIATGLLKGGFGMTPAQFGAWLNGGDAPNGSVFSPKTAKGKPRYSSGNMSGGITKDSHTGSIVGKTHGKRTGWSGERGKGSETWVNVLKGQGILTRKATDALGEENIMALNKGKLPAKTGPWDMGQAGLGAAMAAASAKRIMGQVFQTVANRKMLADAGMDFGTGAVAGKAGKYGNVNLDSQQLANAATIVGVGKSLGASSRDLVIALMTAMQESTLRNLNYGDRDSLGLFQQRNAWGSAADRTNPSKAARMFFLGGAAGQRGLMDFANRNDMTLAQAAQAVQVSAFPDAYAKWEAMARAVLGGTTTKQIAAAGGFGAGIDMSKFGGGSGSGWVMPAKGPITSKYGMRVNPVTGVYRLHAGSDIGAGMGSAIFAAKGGRVVSAGMTSGYGNYTILDHGQGIRTAYAHQSSIGVKPGQMVSQGQVIGRVGSTGNSTGPHLHFEYMKNGVRTNPHDIIPQLWKGGHTLNTGLANLHPKETVLTAPLSQDFKKGVDRFANGDGSGYPITIDLRGAMVSADVDLEKAVEAGVTKALNKKDSRLGRNRKVGNG